MSKTYTLDEIKLLVEKIISQMNFETRGFWMSATELTNTDQSRGACGSPMEKHGLYNDLLGASMTILDACLSDKEQREASKSLVRAKFREASEKTDRNINLMIDYLANPERQYFDEKSNLAQARKEIYKN